MSIWNNWSKYALELFVVFLGVTSSFVMQNTRSNNIEAKQEIKYIEGFIDDTRENIRLLKEQIESDSAWLVNNDYAVKAILNESISFDSASSVVERMASFSKFTPQNSTYSNIVNSGNLGLIKDYDLRQAIITFHKNMDDIGLLEDYFHNHSQQNFIPYMIRNYDMFEKKLSNEKYLTNEFKNLFGIHFSFTTQRMNQYLELLRLGKDLLARMNGKLQGIPVPAESNNSVLDSLEIDSLMVDSLIVDSLELENL